MTNAARTATVANLARLQSLVDYTIEYVSPECWTMGNLRKEQKETLAAVQGCDQEIDGVPADGTFDGCTKTEWQLIHEAITAALAARKAFKLTEDELDTIEG